MPATEYRHASNILLMPPTATLKPLSGAPVLADIRETEQAIAPLIHRTPVFTSAHLDERSGARLFFKCENFQKVDTFKMRGAASAALRLGAGQLRRGLCTHSSGNHAQAVARAARQLQVPAYIVMPENAPGIKRRATAGYGANIISCGPTPAHREARLAAVQAETGAFFIHPYNDWNVIAGQGTAALELWENAGPFDLLLAPVGGGGLISGTAIVGQSLGARVYGSEPLAVDDAYRSLHSGCLQQNETIDTVADGLRTPLGEKTFQVIREQVQDILRVEEKEIVAAMRLVWERMKIIIEPSCAVPVAAVLRYPALFRAQKVGIILTGGNVDLDHLPF
jgi:threonine dehydratase